MRSINVIEADEEKELARRVKAKTAVVREHQRAQIVLLAGSGKKQEEIAQEVGFSRVTAGLWCRRFAEQGIEGLEDAAGRGRKPLLPTDTIRRVLETLPTRSWPSSPTAMPTKKRYVWTAKGEDILRKIQSARETLQKCKARRRGRSSPSPPISAPSWGRRRMAGWAG